MIGLPSALAKVMSPAGYFTPSWYQWANAISKAANKDWGSGVTADRPTGAKIGIGDRYFDTTLVIPIWYDGAIWIKADGTPA